MVDEKDPVISTLRACLISVKGGVPVSHLQRDYKALVGQTIPFQKCGFSSLEKFLRSVPGIRISSDRGELMVEAAATESSAHISSLVNRQKRSGSKKRPSRPFAPSRKPIVSWKPPPSSTRHPQSRVPLSITLSNKNNPSLEDSLRKVTVSSSTPQFNHYSPPISPGLNNPKSPSLAPKNSPKYQIPPRLQKSLSKEIADPPATNELNIQADETVNDTLKQRLKSRLSLNSEISESVLEEHGYRAGVHRQPKAKSIISPLSPMQAVAAGRAKTDAEAIMDLKKTYASFLHQSDEFKSQAEAVMDLKRNFSSYMQPLDISVQHNFQSKPDFHSSQHSSQPITPWNPRYDSRTPPKSPESYLYCEKLKLYSLKKGWPEPVYKILPRYPKNSRPLYGCQVKIGNDQQFSSYPFESVIDEEAREFAAQKAITTLEEMDKKAALDTLNVTEDKALMCERVSQIVSHHTNGRWSYNVLETYRDMYRENVPEDWLTILTSCPYVSMTRVSEKNIIITPNQPSLDNLGHYNNLITAHEPKIQEEVLYVPDLNLPADKHWSVYITCINSPSEVWARLIGDEYSTEYENMTTEMEMHYLNAISNDSADCPEVGYYYAAPFEDSWYRVCVQDISNNKAMCWLIDHGEFDDFPFNKLFKLDKKFFSLPRQAIQCQLIGLEDYGEETVVKNLMLEMVLGKCFVAEVQTRDSNTGVMSLVLYDTSTEEDVNVNQLLINRICIEGSKPQLPSEGTVKEVRISMVTEQGEIYVQVISESLKHLEKLLENLNPDLIVEHKITSFRDIVMNKLYLARYSDGRWYRAQLLQPPSQQHNKIEVKYVDYGNTDTITISDIAQLETISSVLANFPPQAIRVQLHNVPLTSITPQKVSRIRDLLENVTALVKVIESGEVPTVEIFKRVLPDNALVSINSTIILDPSLNQQQQEPRRRTIPNVGVGMVYQTGDSLPARGLQPPNIPSSTSEYFDIFVPMVASPTNFTVQPLVYMNGLSDMMTKMQEYYNQDMSEIDKEAVIEGGVYAVLGNDRNWYRATVTSIITSNMASVRYCDFGDVTIVTFSDMKVLQPQFRELPYLAIKAKLSGIAPSHSDWSVEDCLRFQSLICEKQLVSVVVETGPDIVNQAEIVLGLKIIDTNTDDDIDIAELMVSEGRALLIPQPPASTV